MKSAEDPDNTLCNTISSLDKQFSPSIGSDWGQLRIEDSSHITNKNNALHHASAMPRKVMCQLCPIKTTTQKLFYTLHVPPYTVTNTMLNTK